MKSINNQSLSRSIVIEPSLPPSSPKIPIIRLKKLTSNPESKLGENRSKRTEALLLIKTKSTFKSRLITHLSQSCQTSPRSEKRNTRELVSGRFSFSTSSSASAMKEESFASAAPPMPVLPTLDFFHTPKEGVLLQIQTFISSFGYNYTVTPFYRLRRNGGTSHVLEVFRLLTTYGLPIQCVEAVFIGSVLTAGWEKSLRIPISFKSKFNHRIFRHMILAIYKDGKWGVLGISRRDDLMFKEFQFNSLWDLCIEFERCYAVNHHRLLTVYCGLPLPSNFLLEQKIVWRATKVKLENPSLQASKNQSDQNECPRLPGGEGEDTHDIESHPTSPSEILEAFITPFLAAL